MSWPLRAVVYVGFLYWLLNVVNVVNVAILFQISVYSKIMM